MPDVPLSNFKLGFYGGQAGHAGPFTNVVDLCAAELVPSYAALVGQAGQRSEQQPVLDAAACRQGALVAAAASGLGSARPRMSVDIARSPSSAHALRRAVVVVPKGLGARPSRAGAGVVVQVDGRRLSRRHWALSRAGKVVVRVPGKGGAQRIKVALTRGAIVPGDGLRARARDRMSDLSGARPVTLKLSVYTTELRGKRARTTIAVDGRP